MARRPVILYVEDEAPNRALFRAAVSRAADETIRGVTILEAPDLASARRIIRAEPVDLVLLDVRLPDGNGLDLARDIAAGAAEPNPRPEIFILSASVLPSERESALATGASQFLEKPYVPSELLALIARSLEASLSAR